jgi:UDP-N-acetylglucosamine acyltransferase
MQSRIHPTALVDPGAELGPGVSVGPYAVIGPQVQVGEGTEILSHTVLEEGVQIGAHCRIGPHAVVGGPPQDLKYHGEPTKVVIGDRVQLREFATVHRASVGGDGVTRVGSDCYIMAYAHIGHDCQVAQGVILASQAALGGHVHVGPKAIIGGLSGVHQFVHVGELAFVGGCSGAGQDVPPYVIVQGVPARPVGLNVVGLRRHGFSRESLAAIKQAYKLMYRSDLNTTQALERMAQELPSIPEVERFVAFVKGSKRGVAK